MAPGRVSASAGLGGPRQGDAAAAEGAGRRRGLDQAEFRGEPRQERRAWHQDHHRGEVPVGRLSPPEGPAPGSRIPRHSGQGRPGGGSRNSCREQAIPTAVAGTRRRRAALALHAVHPLRRVRTGLSALDEFRDAARRRTLQGDYQSAVAAGREAGRDREDGRVAGDSCSSPRQTQLARRRHVSLRPATCGSRPAGAQRRRTVCRLAPAIDLAPDHRVRRTDFFWRYALRAIAARNCGKVLDRAAERVFREPA